MSKPLVHPIVNDRVHHTVGHCQPIESEKQVRRIVCRCNVGLVISIYVEHMIWKPTYCKNGDNCDEHSNNLHTNAQQKKIRYAVQIENKSAEKYVIRNEYGVAWICVRR